MHFTHGLTQTDITTLQRIVLRVVLIHAKCVSIFAANRATSCEQLEQLCHVALLGDKKVETTKPSPCGGYSLGLIAS